MAVRGVRERRQELPCCVGNAMTQANRSIAITQEKLDATPDAGPARLEQLGLGGRRTGIQRSKLDTDLGFHATCALVVGIAKNQRSRAKRRALERLPPGKKFAAHRAVLDAILERINWRDGFAFPGFARIARDTGYGRRHVIRCINWLRAHGYVLRKHRKSGWGDQGSNFYTVPALVTQSISMSPPTDTCITT
jgi:hypothetical protein